MTLFGSGVLKFARVYDLWTSDNEVVVQVLGLVESANGWKRRCCLRLPVATWESASRQREIIDLE
jgi:hypothetical protein